MESRGSWTCRICNDTLFRLEFDTILTIPPVPTASFDVGLLNSILALAASTADLRIHLQTTENGSPASIASWSVALAGLLPKKPIQLSSGQIVLRDAVEHRFALPVFDAFSVNVPLRGNVTLADGKIVNADAVEVAIGSSGESIVVTVAFDAPNTNLTVSVSGTPIQLTHVTFQLFQVEISIDFDGRVTLDAQIGASAVILGESIDLSQPIREKLLQKIEEKLRPFVSDTAALKKTLFAFFANLMRLNQIAVPNEPVPFAGDIQDISVDGRTLTASYAIVPVTHQNA
jgi:hypothetical protein